MRNSIVHKEFDIARKFGVELELGDELKKGLYIKLSQSFRITKHIHPDMPSAQIMNIGTLKTIPPVGDMVASDQKA